MKRSAAKIPFGPDNGRKVAIAGAAVGLLLALNGCVMIGSKTFIFTPDPVGLPPSADENGASASSASGQERTADPKAEAPRAGSRSRAPDAPRAGR